MKKWYQTSLLKFVVVLLLALGIILFVGREFDPVTKKESLTLSTSGWKQFRKGMDIAGWVKLSYKVDFSKYDQLYQNAIEREAAKKRAIDIILKNIDKRVSTLWVSDYIARQQIIDGDTFIVVEIGGVSSLEFAKEIIGKTVELEFKVPSDVSDNTTDLVSQRATMTKSLFAQIKKDPTALATLVGWKESDDVYAQMLSGVDYDNLPIIYQTHREKILAAKPGDVLDLGLGEYASASSGEQNSSIKWYTLLVIDSIITEDIPASLSGGETKKATFLTAKEVFVTEKPQWVVAVDPSTKEMLNGAFFSYASTSVGQTGKPVVTITFDDKGKQIFCNLTKAFVNKQMAIFVGGQLLTAPTINEPICQWTAQIDGQFTADSTKQLAEWLNEGALPAPLILSQEEKVSPLLGESAMQWAIKATIVSFILIFVMLLIMYGWQRSLLGTTVLLSYTIYVLAAFKLVDYAFSLSGIAAMILSIGMGVDATILIFERLREELKWGRSRLSAVETAYTRSRSAILDGNVTTILIFVILFFMGMSIFKWFGLAGMFTGGLILLVIAPLTKIVLTYLRK